MSKRLQHLVISLGLVAVVGVIVWAQQPVSITNGGATRTVNGTSSVAQVTTQYDALQSGVTSSMTGTTSTQVIAAVSSNYLYITQCTATQSSTSVGTAVNLQDGSGGTTLYTIPVPAAANSVGVSGSVITFPVPLKVPTLGHALYAANVTTSSAVVLSCSGFASTVSW